MQPTLNTHPDLVGHDRKPPVVASARKTVQASKGAVPRNQGHAAAIAPRNQLDIRRVANWWVVLCGGDPEEDAMAVSKACIQMQAGLELGLGAVESLSSIHIYPAKGKVNIGVGAQAQRALVFASGLVKRWEMTDLDQSAELTVQRVGRPSRTFRVHMRDYRHRVIGAKPESAWIRHPQAMLRARASTIAIKAEFSDILVGIVSHDEGEEIAELELAEEADVVMAIAKDAIEDNVAEAEVTEAGNGGDPLPANAAEAPAAEDVTASEAPASPPAPDQDVEASEAPFTPPPTTPMSPTPAPAGRAAVPDSFAAAMSARSRVRSSSATPGE